MGGCLVLVIVDVCCLYWWGFGGYCYFICGFVDVPLVELAPPNGDDVT